MDDAAPVRRERWRRGLGALLVALGIFAGAFGAHGVTGQQADWMRTGGLYLMIHGLAAIALSDGRYRIAVKLLVTGSGVFAATLFAMVAGAPRWLGAVTPIGGVLMILGWLLVAWTEWRRR